MYVFYRFGYLLFVLFVADFGSQDCYDIPRSFPSDKSCSFEFNENFNSYFVSVVPVFSSLKAHYSFEHCCGGSMFKGKCYDWMFCSVDRDIIKYTLISLQQILASSKRYSKMCSYSLIHLSLVNTYM